MSSALALIVDEETRRRLDVGKAVASLGCEVAFSTPRSASDDAVRMRPDVVLVGATQPDPSGGIDCLGRLHRAFPYPGYVYLAVESSEELVIRALDCGAQRYVKQPWTDGAIQTAVTALLSGLPATCADSAALAGGDRLVGRSRAIRELREQLARVSPAASNVLVTGETGTGKELVAELIHLNGARARRPFVCLNTAAVPDALLESELFGHERGAFTGAVTSEEGKLAAANGGTAFLDEIGDVSLSIQAKLLRAIDGKAFHRLGSSRPVQVDVRLVAATNQDLERAVQEGRFRKDLYYRLNVVRVQLPPLRERSEDIPLLVSHYLRQLNRTLGRRVRGLAPAAMEALCAYAWPGNVRELRNVIEALLVHLAPETTGTVEVPPAVMRQLAFAVGAPTSERERLLHALTATHWNKSKAAAQLHWSRMTLYRKMQRHGVDLHP